MSRIINPFNKKSSSMDTSAHICTCICNVSNDNHDSGIWKSRLTFDYACGCACNKTNKEDNKVIDRER